MAIRGLLLSRGSFWCHALLITLLFTICSAQPLSSCSDQNVAITKTQLDSAPLGNIFWSQDSSVAFMLTKLGDVYRSADAGQTWTNQQSVMADSLVAPTYEIGLNTTVRGVRLILSNADATVFYFQGYQGHFWTTLDLGATYALSLPHQIVTDAYSIDRVFAHPNNPDWVIAYVATRCCWQQIFTCGGGICREDIIISTDKASSWQVTYRDTALPYAADSSSFQPWGFGPNVTNDKTLALYTFPTGEGQNNIDVRFRPDSDWVATFTSDFDAILSNVLSSVPNCWDYWHPPGQTFIVWQPNTVLYSVNGGKTLSTGIFPPAPDAPAGTGDDQNQPDVLVIYVAEDGAFWAVTHLPGTPERFDLYVDVDPAHTAQFTHMLIAPGITGYVVDLMDLSLLADGAVLVANQHPSRTDSRLLSKISWNRGADWQTLAPPAGMCSPNDLASIYGCHLHIQGPTAGGTILSSKLAPGIVVANGNVGPFFNNSANVQTFLSIDAGVSWKPVTGTADTDKGRPNRFTLADNGGIIGFVDSITNTNKFMYTSTYGDVWNSCLFDAADHSIAWMGSDPDSYYPAIILFLTSTTGDNAIVHLNFSRLVDRSCGVGDYENFTLTSGGNNSCVLGQQVVYQRRKPDSLCRIDEPLDAVVSATPCACSRDDFVCDICFENSDSNQCVFQANCARLDKSSAKAPADCNGTYVAPITGYEKIGGTKCVGGAALNVGTITLECPPPATEPAPPVSPSGTIVLPYGRAGIIAGAIIGSVLGAGVLALLGWIIYKVYQKRKGESYERQDLGDEELS